MICCTYFIAKYDVQPGHSQLNHARVLSLREQFTLSSSPALFNNLRYNLLVLVFTNSCCGHAVFLLRKITKKADGQKKVKMIFESQV